MALVLPCPGEVRLSVRQNFAVTGQRFVSLIRQGSHSYERNRQGRRRPAARAAAEGYSDAATQAVDYFVRSSQVVGLGSGPSSRFAIQHLGRKIAEGVLRDITGIPMSAASAAEAAQLGIPLSTLEEAGKVDVAFTDADAVQDGTLFGIVGRRGVPGRDSFIKEKAIAGAAKEFIFLIHGSDYLERLSSSIPVAIEQDNWLETAEEIDDLFLGDAEVWRRPAVGEAGPMGGDFPLVTEQGHFVLDLIFTSPIESITEVAESLDSISGVAGHGIFLDEATAAAVATKDGVKIRTSLFKQAFMATE